MKHALVVVIFYAAVWAQAKTEAPKPGPAAKTAPKAKASGPDLMNPATIKGFAPSVYVVKLDTTRGAIVVRVTRNWAPNGADRFYNLVRAGFYNNTIIFRSTDQYAQFGIPGRPEIAKLWFDRTMPDDR